jgi:adenine-specific DNA-methyltransferase
LAELVWEKGRKNDAKFFSVGHDYILCYARSKQELDRTKTVWREEKPGAREILVEYRRLRQIHGDALDEIQAGIRDFYANLPAGHASLKYRRYNRVDRNGIWRDDNT